MNPAKKKLVKKGNGEGLFTPWTMKLSQGFVKYVIDY